MRVEIVPKGVKVEGHVGTRRGNRRKKRTQQIAYNGNVWRGAVNVHSSGDIKIYILCLEDVYYYFAVKTREGQRAACEERYNRRV